MSSNPSKRPRRSSVKGTSSLAAPAAWGAVLAMVAVACGGNVEGPSGSTTGPGGGGASSGSSTRTAPAYPEGHPCIKNSCSKYVELPDGTATEAPESGEPETGEIKYCFCGNG